MPRTRLWDVSNELWERVRPLIPLPLCMRKEGVKDPYASTKYALNAITLTARQELAQENIHVGLVYPGITGTDFHNHLANGQTWNAPRGRAGAMPMDAPEHVAKKILEAVQTEAAEVYTDSLKAFAHRSWGMTTIRSKLVLAHFV